MRSVRLTANEKRAMRAVIVRRTGVLMHSTRGSLFDLSVRSRVLAAGSVISALLIGSTVSYAAEGALPGDILYPIKVSINEPVRIALAQTSYTKAVVEVDLVDRRLQEAEQLAVEGRLTTETKISLEAGMNEHVGNVESYMASIKAEGEVADSSQIISDMEATLSAHGQVLSAIAQQAPENDERENVVQLAAAVSARTTLNVFAMVSGQEQNGHSEEVSDDGVIQKNAEEKKAQAAAGIIAAQAVVSEDASSGEDSAAVRALTSATGKVSEGEQQLKEGKYSEALRSFTEGVKFTKEAQNIKKLEHKFNVRVGVPALDEEDDEEELSSVIETSTLAPPTEIPSAPSLEGGTETGTSTSNSEPTPIPADTKETDEDQEESQHKNSSGDNFFAPISNLLR